MAEVKRRGLLDPSESDDFLEEKNLPLNTIFVQEFREGSLNPTSQAWFGEVMSESRR